MCKVTDNKSYLNIFCFFSFSKIPFLIIIIININKINADSIDFSSINEICILHSIIINFIFIIYLCYTKKKKKEKYKITNIYIYIYIYI